MPTIAENYARVRDRMHEALARSGREHDEARLLVVSKTWPPETIQEVVDCGHTLFGESRVQEAEAKIPALGSQLQWHFIGHLQKNKVRKILPLCPVLHSIDSLDLARRVDAVASDLGLFPKVFIQVNLAAESSKFGFGSDALRESFGELLAFERLEILGLMCIPPAVRDADEARPFFRQLRSLQEELATAHDVPMRELSMGMSGDYEVALEEGSTIVRVGSSIFGPRKPYAGAANKATGA